MARIGSVAAATLLAGVVAVGVVLLPSAASASPAAVAPAGSSAGHAVAAAHHPAEWAALQEFRTANNTGTFYTLSPDEAAAAQAKFGFRPTGEARGITLATEP